MNHFGVDTATTCIPRCALRVIPATLRQRPSQVRQPDKRAASSAKRSRNSEPAACRTRKVDKAASAATGPGCRRWSAADHAARGARLVPPYTAPPPELGGSRARKDRSCRYESASALATDIQRYLSDEPVSLPPNYHVPLPKSPVSTVGPTCYRNRRQPDSGHHSQRLAGC
jgi:hypothetical protein